MEATDERALDYGWDFSTKFFFYSRVKYRQGKRQGKNKILTLKDYIGLWIEGEQEVQNLVVHSLEHIFNFTIDIPRNDDLDMVLRELGCFKFPTKILPYLGDLLRILTLKLKCLLWIVQNLQQGRMVSLRPS